MSKKFLTLFIIVIVMFFLGCWLYSQFYSPCAFGKPPKIFVVKKGEGLLDIALALKQEGLIKSKLLFAFYVFVKGEQQALKAGEYSLSSSMSISEIAQEIVEGKTAGIKITIIEGWNLKDIAQYFEEKEICQEESFFRAANLAASFISDFDFLNDKPEGANLEGYLFPDTHWLKKTARADEIIHILLTNFGKKVAPAIREEIQSQGKTIFEIIIMASLLEKEVRTKEDKETVAGILWKRLKQGMPLQVDATISYITGKKTTEISIEETQIDSPYNTYKYLGLPLGPICNPGLESILAAVYPKASDYWYYLSTGEGETIFSRTLEEHNIAKAKYLQ